MENKQKLSTDPYKGVRDFYPEDMAIEDYIFDIWQKTAESFGYEKYAASVLEPADLYKAKSGEEIVNEQTYTFRDRGEREVTLRPEMTPTVARLVAAHRRELSLPLRWYSIPNLFRYEQPQRGRLREHWQLNVDLFGLDSQAADAEIITVAHAIMRNFGAKDEDFEIRVNSRKVLEEKIGSMLRDQSMYASAIRLIDKKEKMNDDDFAKKWQEFSERPLDMDFGADEQLQKMMGMLEKAGVTNIRFAPSLTRGFDYYTGMVFEIFDTNRENRRSLFGGGRYDDLTSLFGGEQIPAVGFGMGDVTIRDFLETHGLLPQLSSRTLLHICTLDPKFVEKAEEIATSLRSENVNVSVNLTDKKVGDQIAWAGRHRIPFIACIGEEEIFANKVHLKNLETGQETEVSFRDIAKAIVK